MKSPLKPWLYLPADKAHDWMPVALKQISRFRRYRSYTWDPFTWEHLEFSNRLGIAGGVDKNAYNVKDWWTWGPGFIEVGTVTPRPQEPNPGKVVDRSIDSKALWNKLGFPNHGSDAIKDRLEKIKLPHFTPVFVNIGKNRHTKNEKAVEDYLQLIKVFREVADAFVVNVSSPNTEGLRNLLEPKNLEELISPLVKLLESKDQMSPPLLLKLSPDMSSDQIGDCVRLTKDLGVKGWIVTNTTTERKSKSLFPKDGGVSGEPLKEKSLLALKTVCDVVGKNQSDYLIVSVGGVLTPGDVIERIKLGAHLVQVYTALAFEGPNFFQKVNDEAHSSYALGSLLLVTSEQVYWGIHAAYSLQLHRFAIDLWIWRNGRSNH